LRWFFKSDIILLAGCVIAIILTLNQPIIAAALTYVSILLSGEVSPFWRHVCLLSFSVAASVAVGAGIIFERPKYSPSVHRVAFWLVVVGIAVEAVCTIFLFVFDEGISHAQQSKIISLEEYISGRRMTKGEFDAIQALKGKVQTVGISMEAHCPDCINFGTQITRAFDHAGIKVIANFPGFEGGGNGCVYDPPGTEDVVSNAFRDGGFGFGKCPNPAPGMSRELLNIAVFEGPSFPYPEPPYLGAQPENDNGHN
jgi:hypothetical protein